MGPRIGFNLNTAAKQVSRWFTIRKSAQGKGTYSSNVGSCSILASVELRIEPYVGLEQFLLEWQVIEAQIPLDSLSAIIEGIRQVAQKERADYGPLTQIKVIITDGAYHAIDSQSYAYTKATMMAFEEALTHTEIVLLDQNARDLEDRTD